MRRYLVAPVLILMTLVLACQKDQPLPQHQSSAAPESSAAPAADVAPPAPASTEPAPAPATSPPAAVAGGIATTDGEQSGISLTVTEFKRGSGDTATLKFTIVNNGTEALEFGYGLADPANSTIDYGTIGGVHLIDPVNKKKYFVVRDSDKRCVCSRDLKKIDPGSSLNLWAKFPAPVDTQSVTIVVPHFMPMDDVPVS